MLSAPPCTYRGTSAWVKFDDWSQIFQRCVLLLSTHSSSSQDDIFIASQMSDGSLQAGTLSVFLFSLCGFSLGDHRSVQRRLDCTLLLHHRLSAFHFSVHHDAPDHNHSSYLAKSRCLCPPERENYYTYKKQHSDSGPGWRFSPERRRWFKFI